MADEPGLVAEVDVAARDGAGLEVAVVGAGAVGATAAYDLARAGVDVTLYDRGPVGSGASGRAAGICYDAFADPTDAAIAGESIERFRSLSDDTVAFVECPYVWLAREGDAAGADTIRDGVARMQAVGVVALEMDPASLADRFPSLRTDDVAVAGVAGAAGYTDPAAYTDALAAMAVEAGATLETETPVSIRPDPTRVETDDGTAREVDALLVAAGAHTKSVLAEADLAVATKPYRVQALVASASLAEPMCYDATGDFYVGPHPDGILAGDGTEPREVDPDGYDREADPGFADDLSDRVGRRFPDLERRVDRAWAGCCTATPDGDPLVGHLEADVFVATGFHGQGFMRAPAIGRRIADEVLGGPGIDAYDPARFTGDESVEIREGLHLDRADTT